MVRRAAGNVAGLVGGGELGEQPFDEGFQGGAVGVLGGETLGEGGLEGGEVGGDGRHLVFLIFTIKEIYICLLYFRGK